MDEAEKKKPPLAVLLAEARALVCYGLGYLHARKFQQAALQFVRVPYEIGDSFHQVVTAADIARLGTVCALATFSRAQLKSALLDNEGFQVGVWFVRMCLPVSVCAFA
jgi:COP9 signalosome complex subunit 1